MCPRLLAGIVRLDLHMFVAATAHHSHAREPQWELPASHMAYSMPVSVWGGVDRRRSRNRVTAVRTRAEFRPRRGKEVSGNSKGSVSCSAEAFTRGASPHRRSPCSRSGCAADRADSASMRVPFFPITDFLQLRPVVAPMRLTRNTQCGWVRTGRITAIRQKQVAEIRGFRFPVFPIETLNTN